MLIREARSGDIENIARLYVTNWKKTYGDLLPADYLEGLDIPHGMEKWSRFMERPGHHVFVAYDDSRFLGFGACSPEPDIESCMYLDSLHVSAEAQGKGVGTKLIRTIADHSIDTGCSKMSICIVRGNERARDLYCKLGAVHYSYFIDDFGGALSRSEKLVWTDLELFQK